MSTDYATTTEAEPRTELTDELADVLTAVLDGTIDASPSDSPAAELTAVEIRRAEQQRDRQAAALSVLERLGYVYMTDAGSGEFFIEPAGRVALAAREAAKEAARIQAVRASYAVLVAELHAIADAIDAVPVDGLAELSVEMRIATKYSRTEVEAVKVATVDAIAASVLDKAAKTERLGSSELWQHKVEARRGPVKVEVDTFVEDPSTRERDAAEQARQDEVERLRAELAEAHARLNLVTTVDTDSL